MKHLILSLLAAPALAFGQHVVQPVPLPPPGSRPHPIDITPAAHAWAAEHLRGWPVERQTLAARLVSKYGPPQEANARSITWYDNGPWRRTELYRAGTLHNFPLPHVDVLWQTISYRVPVSKIAALVAYDGSILVDRSRGEITVHCDSEEANFITLNIAHDIITGEDTTEQAQAHHAQIVEGMRIGDPEEYPEHLMFKPVRPQLAADPGQEAELLVHLGEH
ncbi:MAG TPA: hypothetical protein VMB48_17470 [Steroidobacteraceae bacterium]|nr:hypothetical protein [Steroidobacteraceae bacterium]